MNRVERMFGPRESWGKGDEMAAVRERARRDGGQGRGGRKAAAPQVSKALEKAKQKYGAGEAVVIPAAECAPERKSRKHRENWGGLAGFVSIRCGGCGKVANTCLRTRTPKFVCKDCDYETPLDHVANIHMKCRSCGFEGKYRTNRTEEQIQMECLNCSNIEYLTRIRRGNYVLDCEVGEGRNKV